MDQVPTSLFVCHELFIGNKNYWRTNFLRWQVATNAAGLITNICQFRSIQASKKTCPIFMLVTTYSRHWHTLTMLTTLCCDKERDFEAICTSGSEPCLPATLLGLVATNHAHNDTKLGRRSSHAQIVAIAGRPQNSLHNRLILIWLIVVKIYQKCQMPRINRNSLIVEQ